MPKDAARVVNTMFQGDDRKTFLADPKFRQAMAEFDGTPEGVQRLADCGTNILLPEEKRPPLRRH
jgi:hypothetical protein